LVHPAQPVLHHLDKLEQLAQLARLVLLAQLVQTAHLVPLDFLVQQVLPAQKALRENGVYREMVGLAAMMRTNV